jgi:hypothetical protein
MEASIDDAAAWHNNARLGELLPVAVHHLEEA